MKWLIFTRPVDWRYHVSRALPLPMRSTYGVIGPNSSWTERARWWQWRGRVFAHRIVVE